MGGGMKRIGFGVFVVIVFLPSGNAWAFLNMKSPARAGLVDIPLGKPEEGNEVLKAPDYLSGSVQRIGGKDVNVPVACPKNKACAFFLTADLDSVPEMIGMVKNPLSVEGQHWVLGTEQLVNGGFGPLAAVNGGLEPTGRKVVNLGIDNESEFKAVAIDIDDASGTVKIQAFFRACIRYPKSKKWWTCTPYFIPGPFVWTLKETDFLPIDIAIGKEPLKLPKSLQNTIRNTATNSLKNNAISTGISTAQGVGTSVAGSVLSGGGSSGGSSSSSNGAGAGTGGYQGSFTGRTMPPVNVGISSGYGMRVHPKTGIYKKHDGIDFPVPIGTPVKAIASGKIFYQGWISGYGNTVVIDHGSGYMSLYAHLKDSGFIGQVGSNVPTGAVVALSGSTGMSTGPHLHLTVVKGFDGRNLKSGKDIDPRSFIRF
jgi:murein DD-endopeptidase MepM/ murein hydrolase activator NlpD